MDTFNFKTKTEKKKSITERVREIVGNSLDIKYISLDDKKIIDDGRFNQLDRNGIPYGLYVKARHDEKKRIAEEKQDYDSATASTSV